MDHAEPPGYTPSRTPAATNRTEATSMSSTTGRRAPATTAPLPRGPNGSRSPPRRIRAYRVATCFERRDVLRWNKDATEIGAVVAATMKIGPTGRDQIEARSQAQAFRGSRRRVGTVVALDAGEPRGDELWEQLLETQDRSRMREGGHAAVRAHQLNGFD